MCDPAAVGAASDHGPHQLGGTLSGQRWAIGGEIAFTQVQATDGGRPELCVSLARTLVAAWPVGGHVVSVSSAADQLDTAPLYPPD